MTQHSYMETIALLPHVRGLTKLISHSRTRAAEQDLLKGPVSECLSNKANRIRTTLGYGSKHNLWCGCYQSPQLPLCFNLTGNIWGVLLTTCKITLEMHHRDPVLTHRLQRTAAHRFPIDEPGDFTTRFRGIWIMKKTWHHLQLNTFIPVSPPLWKLMDILVTRPSNIQHSF